MAYREADAESPRRFSLHHARGGTLVFFAAWMLMFLYVTVNPNGERYDRHAAMVFGPLWGFFLLLIVRAWFLRLDLEHYERDGRMRITWKRWPRAPRVVEVPASSITDVVTISSQSKPNSRKGIALIMGDEKVDLTTSRSGDDTKKKIAALKAFLRIDTPERTVFD